MILSFININRKRALIIVALLMIILGLYFLSSFNFKKNVEQKKYLLKSERHKNGNYVISMISNDGDIVFKKDFPQKPNIDEVDNNVYKISVSTGSNSNYTFFVNTNNMTTSNEYFNLIFNNKTHVVYMRDNTVFVADMFDESNISLVVTRNYSPTAVPQSAILSASIKDNILELEYLAGDDYTVVIERIKIP